MRTADHITLCSIAGWDPTGGAGLGADLQTFAAYGARGAGVVTVLTAQDEQGIHAQEPVDEDLVRAQLDAVWKACPPQAVKIGMLPTAGVVGVVASFLEDVRRDAPDLPIVLDPVLGATGGGGDADDETLLALATRLRTQVTVLTPNTAEAARLAAAMGLPAAAAGEIVNFPTPPAVITTGVEVDGDRCDILDLPGGRMAAASRSGISGGPFHGTGCAFSSALAVHLAHGRTLVDALERAGDWVHRRIEAAAAAGAWLLPPVDPGT